MASGLRKRSTVINYACLDYEATDLELLEDDKYRDPDVAYRQRPARCSSSRGESSSRPTSAPAASAASQDDVLTRSRSQQPDGGPRQHTSSRCASSDPVTSPSSDPTSPTAATATAAESITTPPLAVAGAASSDDVGTQPVCAFCGSADAPLSFGDCEPEHFPTSADFRISSLRRGAHQAPLGSLSMDKLTDFRSRRRPGGHEARQSRRGTFIWAHRFCAQWSEGVFSDNGKLIGVDEAVLRGLTERCSVCQNVGATITCRSARCRHAYHLPCATLDDSYLDGETMTIACPDHLGDIEVCVGERGACRRCSSFGDVKDMFFCFMCGGHEHGMCNHDTRQRSAATATPESRAKWKCSECKMCTVCRSLIPEEEISTLCVECLGCGRLEHVHCADLKKKTLDWRCEQCRECSDCSCKTAGSGPTARWHRGYTQCSACYQRALKLRPCSVCEEPCTPSEDLKCTTCSRLMHSTCVESVPSDLSLFRCDSCSSLVGALSPSPRRRSDMSSLVVKVRKERLNITGRVATLSRGSRPRSLSPPVPQLRTRRRTVKKSSSFRAAPRRPSLPEESLPASGGEVPTEVEPRDASAGNLLESDPCDDKGDKNESDCIEEPMDSVSEKSRSATPGTSRRRTSKVRLGAARSTSAMSESQRLASRQTERTGKRNVASVAKVVAASQRRRSGSGSRSSKPTSRIGAATEGSSSSLHATGTTLELTTAGSSIFMDSSMEVLTESSLGGAEVIMADEFCTGGDVVGFVEQEVGSDVNSSSATDSDSDVENSVSTSLATALAGNSADSSSVVVSKASAMLDAEDEDADDNDKEDEIMAALKETSEGLERPLLTSTPTAEIEARSQPPSSGPSSSGGGGKASKRIRQQRPRRSRQTRPRKLVEQVPTPPPVEEASVAELSPDDKQDSKEDSAFYAMETAVLIFANIHRNMMMSDVCSACGSIGKEEEAAMLCCSQCGHCYHPYCVNAKINNITLTRGWRCLMCMVCEGCGSPQDEEHLLLCDSCDVSYHTYCLKPQLDKVPEGSWKCKWCVQCLSCGATTPGVNSKWQSNYTQCAPCASTTNCSICSRKYRTDDLIVACEVCKKWAHGACHGLKTEQAMEEASAGADGFACKPCMQHLKKVAAAAAAAQAVAAAQPSPRQPSPSQPALPPPATPPTPKAARLPSPSDSAIATPNQAKKPLRDLTQQELDQLKFLEEYTQTRQKGLADAGVKVTTQEREEEIRVQRRIRERVRRAKRDLNKPPAALSTTGGTAVSTAQSPSATGSKDGVQGMASAPSSDQAGATPPLPVEQRSTTEPRQGESSTGEKALKHEAQVTAPSADLLKDADDAAVEQSPIPMEIDAADGQNEPDGAAVSRFTAAAAASTAAPAVGGEVGATDLQGVSAAGEVATQESNSSPAVVSTGLKISIERHPGLDAVKRAPSSSSPLAYVVGQDDRRDASPSPSTSLAAARASVEDEVAAVPGDECRPVDSPEHTQVNRGDADQSVDSPKLIRSTSCSPQFGGNNSEQLSGLSEVAIKQEAVDAELEKLAAITEHGSANLSDTAIYTSDDVVAQPAPTATALSPVAAASDRHSGECRMSPGHSPTMCPPSPRRDLLSMEPDNSPKYVRSSSCSPNEIMYDCAELGREQATDFGSMVLTEEALQGSNLITAQASLHSDATLHEATESCQVKREQIISSGDGVAEQVEPRTAAILEQAVPSGDITPKQPAAAAASCDVVQEEAVQSSEGIPKQAVPSSEAVTAEQAVATNDVSPEETAPCSDVLPEETTASGDVVPEKKVSSPDVTLEQPTQEVGDASCDQAVGSCAVSPKPFPSSSDHAILGQPVASSNRGNDLPEQATLESETVPERVAEDSGAVPEQAVARDTVSAERTAGDFDIAAEQPVPGGDNTPEQTNQETGNTAEQSSKAVTPENTIPSSNIVPEQVDPSCALLSEQTKTSKDEEGGSQDELPESPTGSDGLRKTSSRGSPVVPEPVGEQNDDLPKQVGENTDAVLGDEPPATGVLLETATQGANDIPEKAFEGNDAVEMSTVGGSDAMKEQPVPSVDSALEQAVQDKGVAPEQAAGSGEASPKSTSYISSVMPELADTQKPSTSGSDVLEKASPLPSDVTPEPTSNTSDVTPEPASCQAVATPEPSSSTADTSPKPPSSKADVIPESASSKSDVIPKPRRYSDVVAKGLTDEQEMVTIAPLTLISPTAPAKPAPAKAHASTPTTTSAVITSESAQHAPPAVSAAAAA
eukprot:scpid6286/ scgid1536/ Histone-lysine N-methyltransferase MLL3; Homologous to ALR protein; Lysine N-methyltransferase 2C; Myeloid/lymphoid or mixed-lineage leukemia protein 3